MFCSSGAFAGPRDRQYKYLGNEKPVPGKGSGRPGADAAKNHDVGGRGSPCPKRACRVYRPGRWRILAFLPRWSSKSATVTPTRPLFLLPPLLLLLTRARKSAPAAPNPTGFRTGGQRSPEAPGCPRRLQEAYSGPNICKTLKNLEPPPPPPPPPPPRPSPPDLLASRKHCDEEGWQFSAYGGPH